MLSYDIVNVFIADGEKFSGNPLAVFYDAEKLTQEQCLALGRQFNLSEITFPFEVKKSTYRVRIFTPGAELPFAGHPTLGTCFALLHHGLEFQGGEAVQTSLSGATKLYFPKQVQAPTSPTRICMRATPHFITGRLDQKLNSVPAILGHNKSNVHFVRRASCGLPWLYARFDSPDAVINGKISSSHLQDYTDELRGLITAEEARDNWITGVVAFAVMGNTEEGLEIKARVFYMENGVLTEDSATGSAALGLGLVLHAEDMITSIAPKYKILQGYEALKPSQLYGEVEVEGDKVVGVRVAGDVVKVGHGEIEIP